MSVAAGKGVVGAEVQLLEHVRTEIAAVWPPDVTLDETGHTLTVQWRGVPGATGARVGAATVTVRPASSGNGRDVGVAAAAASDTTVIDVRSPEPGALVRALVIPGLVRLDTEAKVTETPSDRRLVVRPVVNGQDQAPVVAVPPLDGAGMLPAQLTGATYAGGVLRLPDLVGSRFKVSLCTGNAPEDFAPQSISHDDVRMLVAPGPSDVTVVGPDGTDLFALSGPLARTTDVDVRAGLERHLTSVAGVPTASASIRVKAKGRGAASVVLKLSGGVLERKVDGRHSVETSGDPVGLDISAPASRPPSRTTADLTITHHGLALHAVSDALPTRSADLGGPVVRDQPVQRLLPPEAMRGQRIRRVCVVGRVLAEADLQLELLGRGATLAGLPARVLPGAQPYWFELGEDLVVDGPPVVTLWATRGVFGWVAEPNPLVRFAVVTEAGGTTMSIGGQVRTLTGPETVFPGAVLAGASPWPVATAQFCSVAVSNVMQEFAP